MGCGSDDDGPADDDVPELTAGQPTKLLTKHFKEFAPYCGLLSAVPLILWDYSKAKFDESYAGNGYWMLRTRIDGAGTFKTIRKATWRVNEDTKKVENISGPEDC